MTEQESTATVELDSPHAPEDVWEALTSDKGLAEWMGEGAKIEAEIDGALELPDPVTGRAKQGFVDRLDVGERLDFTWWPLDDPKDESHVSIVLEPIETGTRIRVTETAMLSVASCRADWTWRGVTLTVGLSLGRIAA